MTRRIGLLGGECTGKSVLATELADALGACLVRERLRAFVDEHGRPPLQHEQAEVMQQQIDAEAAEVARCRAAWLIGEPAPLMTAVYSEVYFADASLTSDGLAHAASYDLLLWCDDDIPWVPDGAQRDGPQFRAREQATIARILQSSGLPVTRVAGDVQTRLRAALSRCAEVAG